MESIVITGANRGIGLGLVRRFLGAGWRVVATCRRSPGGAELQALAGTGDLRIRELEVTDEGSVAAFCASLAGEAVDVLVNNAGVIGGERQGLDDMDYAAWRDALEVNVLAPFRLATALRPSLARAKRPRIVTLSSQMGALAAKSPGFYAYRSSKAAVNKVMQVMAVELASEGMIVCPVHPGWVRTEMGGPQAEISVEESASGLFDLIDGMTIEHSGRFWTWQGAEHPW